MPERKPKKSTLQKKLEADGWRFYSNIPYPIDNVEHPVRDPALLKPIKYLEDMDLQVRIEPAYDIFGRRLKDHRALYSKAREDKP